MLGRRGPAQAAFTNPELRELGEMTDADIVVDPADAALDPHSAAWLEREDAEARERHNVEIATEYSTRTPAGQAPADRAALPRLAGRDHRRTVTSRRVRLVRNELVPNADGSLSRATDGRDGDPRRAGSSSARSATAAASCRAAVRRAARARSATSAGARSTSTASRSPASTPRAGSSAGRRGVIGTNKKDAHETVDALLEDRAAGRLPGAAPIDDDVSAFVAERCPDYVDYTGWKRIDAHEQALGEPQGRPRVKLTDIAEMLEIAGRERVS